MLPVAAAHSVLRRVRVGVRLQHHAELLLNDFSFLYTQSCRSEVPLVLKVTVATGWLKTFRQNP